MDENNDIIVKEELNTNKDFDIAFRIIITFIEGFIASILASMPYIQENPSKEVIRITYMTGVCMGISAVINMIKAIFGWRKLNNEK